MPQTRSTPPPPPRRRSTRRPSKGCRRSSTGVVKPPRRRRDRHRRARRRLLRAQIVVGRMRVASANALARQLLQERHRVHGQRATPARRLRSATSASTAATSTTRASRSTPSTTARRSTPSPPRGARGVTRGRSRRRRGGRGHRRRPSVAAAPRLPHRRPPCSSSAAVEYRSRPCAGARSSAWPGGPSRRRRSSAQRTRAAGDGAPAADDGAAEVLAAVAAWLNGDDASALPLEHGLLADGDASRCAGSPALAPGGARRPRRDRGRSDVASYSRAARPMAAGGPSASPTVVERRPVGGCHRASWSSPTRRTSAVVHRASPPPVPAASRPPTRDPRKRPASPAAQADSRAVDRARRGPPRRCTGRLRHVPRTRRQLRAPRSRCVRRT